NAVFADLSFRSDLDVIAVGTNGDLRVMSNLQNMYFVDTTTNLAPMRDVRGFAVDDWNNDEILDLFVATASGPTLWIHQRGGGYTNAADKFPAGNVFAVGDVNNDLRTDLLVAGAEGIAIIFGGGQQTSFPLNGFAPTDLKLIDYDNDGWLDLVALGSSMRVWRNFGARGFRDVTAVLGLDKLKGRADSIAAADLDGDCDTDFVVSLDGALHLLRNDGGNANRQLKLQLRGTRSNPSALGTRIEISAGGLRTARRVMSLPVELGVGKHDRIDAITAQWIELTTTQDEVPATCATPLVLIEPSLPTGSCPNLYAWDGERFRFVTDLLGSAPLGLPVAPGKYIEADEDELVVLGDDAIFKPRGSNYVVQLTEELREVLYLDQVELVVVDHPPSSEVHTTDKLRSRRPAGGFPRGEIVTLGNRVALRSFERAPGVSPGPGRQDAGDTLTEIDGKLISPKLREPQYRGLAESHSVTLDFGPLDTHRPLVLALTGWLRFGGGTANIAASAREDFPFPFPILEAELASGEWKSVYVEVGAPSGKTKTIIVNLAGKLPTGTQRLRLSAAFEIHWDRIALFEQLTNAPTHIVRITPSRTHLHWRGYSEFADLPPSQPLTPVYEMLKQDAPWIVTPSGWATRYGEVNELVHARDNALATIAGGDELTVEFSMNALPRKPEGVMRDFFIFASGWDKDSDYHVVSGTTLEPLPWHGLDEQTYGTAPRPQFTNDAWIQKYNTRWVGPRVTVRASR
ncbi:MAG TPA: VCBS repeat-containing protein, partial [Candidatus Acidoferrum sp.]|nr:VCBS repeat-containing protein [Candidatus Acidoferrum sp.]